MKKIILLIIIFLSIGFIGWTIASNYYSFKRLNPEEMRQRIIQERDYAIAAAVKLGDFRCCINPPCTMCYMEGNKWNYDRAGTCACDDFIAKGEEPCPQCAGGNTDFHDDDNTFCDLNFAASSCETNLIK